MKMPSGKYQGKSLFEVPNDYLSWLLDHMDIMSKLDNLLRDAIERELSERAASGYYVPVDDRDYD